MTECTHIPPDVVVSFFSDIRSMLFGMTYLALSPIGGVYLWASLRSTEDDRWKYRIHSALAWAFAVLVVVGFGILLFSTRGLAVLLLAVTVESARITALFLEYMSDKFLPKLLASTCGCEARSEGTDITEAE